MGQEPSNFPAFQAPNRLTEDGRLEEAPRFCAVNKNETKVAMANGTAAHTKRACSSSGALAKRAISCLHAISLELSNGL